MKAVVDKSMYAGNVNQRVLSKNTIGLIVLICLGSLLLDNGLYLFTCILTLIILFAILWRKNRPGILLFAFFMQWTQVISYVIWMDVRGVDINYLTNHADIAVIIGCLGLIFMAAITSVVANKLPTPTRKDLGAASTRINEKKIFILYLGSTLFLSSIGFILGATSGFTQILVTLSSIKWIFFLVYGYVAWINKKNRIILLVMIAYEFTTSLYSYFSSFKQVLLVAIVLTLTFLATIKFKQVLYSLLIVLFLGGLAITWSAIKGDYREYVNQGSRQQVVSVTREQAFSKIGEQISSLTWRQYEQALYLSLYRLQYVYHLAKTMDRVPDELPHENGQLWVNNVSYVLLPRLLFPDKPIFDATEKTNKYTGLNYSGYEQGASFGLGYFTDCYIDFGYFGMFFPLAMIALFVAFIYRTFYKMKNLSILVRYGLINICLFNFTSFESDGIIVFGRILITFLVFWALAKTILPLLQKWLYKK